ncbi:hypothetical protein [Nocardia asteroides]|uniref:hypothetical protein n=1 Tax=Nocardia asteroides TaxID=1824 RepID=UPI001E2876F4|nr:hypothetical protein [Nocardia asteroides]UGT53761.1 hypothetical protein LTT85_24230 [Nocardia asteroides]
MVHDAPELLSARHFNEVVAEFGYIESRAPAAARSAAAALRRAARLQTDVAAARRHVGDAQRHTVTARLFGRLLHSPEQCWA